MKKKHGLKGAVYGRGYVIVPKRVLTALLKFTQKISGSLDCAKLPTVLCMIFQEQLSELRCKPFSLLSLNSQTPALFPSPFQF